MVSGGTRGGRGRAFRWFERKPRIPARYPFQRTMIRQCLCAIRNGESLTVGLSLITGKEHRQGWGAVWQGVGERLEGRDESLDGGLLSITRPPRDESLATRRPLFLSLCRPHCEIPAEIRARFGRNFGILIQLGGWKIDGRACPWKWSLIRGDFRVFSW